MKFENSLAFAKSLDAADELGHFRQRFILPMKNNEEQIYFLGNSLGLQPKSASFYIQEILAQWSQYGVEAFFEGPNPWMDYHDQLQNSLAKIVGGLPHEVVVMNQLTVNLHLMMASFYRPISKRKKVLCEAKAFPSDQYMLETHLKFLGFDPDETIIELKPRVVEHTLRTEDILKSIDVNKDELALVLMGGVNYYTGEVLDMKSITKAAHQAGAIIGFDLAHAAGNIELSLHEWDVDFACWCGYKYLNSGPGGVAGAFIHQRYHKDHSVKRLAGWWGFDKNSRFKMEKGFQPVPGAEGWQLSTPALLLLACQKASLEIFEEAGMEKLVKKGQLLSSYLLFLLNEIIQDSKENFIDILTPVNNFKKGCQVSMLMLENGKDIFTGLRNNGIFADWREPNVIRIAPVPLYNTFLEVWKFVNAIDRLRHQEHP